MIKGLGTYKSEFLTPDEYLSVLSTVGLKNILQEKERFFMILESLPCDDMKRIDYNEFLKTYNEVNQGISKGGLSTRRTCGSYEECVQIIADVLPQREKINLGALLSGADSNQDRILRRDQMYRIIDGLNSRLAEGDIISILNHLDPMNSDKIDIRRFADDVNRFVRDQRYLVRFNAGSVHQTISETIVDPTEFGPSKSKQRANLLLLKPLVLDILCGLKLIGKPNPRAYFMEHAIRGGNSLGRNELLNALQ